jgi:flavin reductase (DIM6/NTAB) family NADH-FMN oxidoreductase RutF
MFFDFQSIQAGQRYKLMTGLIVPRPIAWVTSLHADGKVNVAPFSFFNAIGTDPGLIVLGISNHPDRPKDTAVNIERTGEFVVNLVPKQFAQAMSDSATDYPPNVSEVEELGLTTLPSTFVQPPRLAGVPAAFECKLERSLMIGENRVIFGLVLGAFVEDHKIRDAERGIVDTEALQLVGRMGGLGGYTHTDHTFQLERKKYQPT